MKKTITLHHDKETQGTNRFSLQDKEVEERVADSIYIRKPFFAKCKSIILTIEGLDALTKGENQ